MKHRQWARAALVAALAWGIAGISPGQVPQGIFTGVRNVGFEAGVNTPFFEYQPVVSPDGKELYFATSGSVDAERALSAQGDDDMWVATRGSPDEPFGNVRNLQDADLAIPGIVLNSWSTENPGSISRDLQELYFASYRDGTADLSDAIYLLGSLFLGDREPSCDKAADTNDDGKIDISDPVFLLGYLLLGSKAPNQPLGSCGPDPTEDALSCESFARCP